MKNTTRFGTAEVSSKTEKNNKTMYVRIIDKKAYNGCLFDKWLESTYTTKDSIYCKVWSAANKEYKEIYFSPNQIGETKSYEELQSTIEIGIL